MPAVCSPSGGDHLVPVEVRVAFLSGLEAEAAQPLQYRLAKDAEADQKDTELVLVFHERTSVLHIASCTHWNHSSNKLQLLLQLG